MDISHGLNRSKALAPHKNQSMHQIAMDTAFIQSKFNSPDLLSNHKFLAPQSDPLAVEREHLLNRIFSQTNYNLIVVQAPAGHGKSTLLQQVKTRSEAAKVITGWLNFDEADNDIKRFCHHLKVWLMEICQHAHPLDPEDESNGVFFAEWMIDYLQHVQNPIHLFFDDVQYLRHHKVIYVLRELIQHLPKQVKVFMGTRVMPDIGIARLRVNNKALLLDAEVLRFALNEAQQFFNKDKTLAITQEEIHTIYSQTEGWPAALQLFRLSLSSPIIRQSLKQLEIYRSPELAEYLIENVLLLQQPDVQDFLLQTSVLTCLSAELCNDIMGIENAQSTLAFLEKSGLFLRSLSVDAHWYKYHALFSTSLSEQLSFQNPSTFKAVHLKAAKWFYEHHMLEEAMYHATTGKNYQFATTILNAWSDQLIANGYLPTVERWADALPLTEIVEHTELAIKIAWAYSFLRRHHKLNQILNRLEQLNDTDIDMRIIRIMQALSLDDIPKAFMLIEQIDFNTLALKNGQSTQGFYSFQFAAAANVNCYRALCYFDFAHVRDHLHVAQGYNLQSGAEFSSGYTIAVIGMSLLIQGHLEDALLQYRNGLNTQHHDFNQSIAAAAMASCYLQALYEHNELDEVERLFTHYREMISTTALLDFMAAGYVAAAKTYYAKSEYHKTEHILSEAEDLACSVGWPRLSRIILWERVRYALLNQDIQRATWLAQRITEHSEFSPPQAWMSYSEVIEGHAIGRIRLAIYQGELEQAISALTLELVLAEQCHSVFRLIKLSILEAMVYDQLQQIEQTQQALARAFKFAVPEQFIRIFLDEGDKFLKILSDSTVVQVFAETPYHDFILQILQISKNKSQTLPIAIESFSSNAVEVIHALTEREKDILIYLSNGVSNKEIARHICVSENTIKFHLKNIYHKLDVNTRIQAINTARALGVVDD